MDKQNSWKRTEDIQIDLMDLLQKLCLRWKQIFVCALVCAVAAGSYGSIKGRSSPEVSETEILEDFELTEAEERSVAQAVEQNDALRKLEEYVNHSVIMRTDPYHRPKVIMLYSISQTESRRLQDVTESYISFLANGGALDELKKSGSRKWNMDKSYLAELITAFQKTYSQPYQISADSASDNSNLADALFYVEVTGEDAKMAEQLAEDLQSVIKEHAAVVKKRAGSHKLVLLSTEKSDVYDRSLQAHQNELRSLMYTNQTNLAAMVNAFSKGQAEAYKDIAGREEEDEIPDKPEEAEEPRDSGISIKYTGLGLLGGIFVYCCVFGCFYLFRDTVKSVEEMKQLYTFSFFGGIPVSGRKNRYMGKHSAAAGKDYELARVRTLNRIRLACEKQEIKKICLAAGFLFEGKERECMDSLASQLKDWGIDAVVIENAGIDTNMWNVMAETGNVLMVCRMGTTTHRMIDDDMRFYLDNEIAVAGAMAFI